MAAGARAGAGSSGGEARAAGRRRHRRATRTESAAPAPGSLHWTALGPPDAPAIVFVHGTRLTRAQWIPQLRRLSGRYRCVAIDLPGHGSRAAERFTIDAAVRAVTDAIEAEAASGSALIVGFSIGGYVAIEVAQRHPERVVGLVLAGCSAEPVGPATMPFRAFAWVLEHVPTRVQDLVSVFLLRARYHRSVAEPIIAGGFWPDGGWQAIRALGRHRYLDRLSRLWTPVVVVNGALDPVFGPGGDPWATACRRGRHVVIPGAMHLVGLDRPSAFSRAVAAAMEDALAHPGDAV